MKKLLIMAAALLLVACGGKEEVPEPETGTGSETEATYTYTSITVVQEGEPTRTLMPFKIGQDNTIETYQDANASCQFSVWVLKNANTVAYSFDPWIDIGGNDYRFFPTNSAAMSWPEDDLRNTITIPGRSEYIKTITVTGR